MPNTLSTWIRVCLLVAFFAGSASGRDATPSCDRCLEWNKPQAPFRIFGNTYYVGTRGLSSVLITSDAGHVLVDGALPESAQQIVANIQTLGFRIEDVKLIVNSHVHFDHAGGIAELQRLSGAHVVASKWSTGVLKAGRVGRADPQYGETPAIRRVKQVSVLRDGETFHVGGNQMTAHVTAGHTPGGTSWTWKSCEGNTCLNMVYADSLTPVSAEGFLFTKSRQYPTAMGDFEKSFAFLEGTACDILVTPHPETSGLWDRLEARNRGVSPNPMVDPGSCSHLATEARGQLRERVAKEKKP